MGLTDYVNDDAELVDYISGKQTLTSIDQTVYNIMSTKTNGIEGLPYQFMPSVDTRIMDSDVGRKYGERIFARLPLLFLTPCEPLFMDDFSKANKNVAKDALVGNIANWQSLLNESGKYYSTRFNYVEYYEYLNTMLACVAANLGIFNEKIKLSNGEPKKIGYIDWSSELNGDFKTFFASEENVIFYLDNLTSVSESFSNETTESSLASQINGFADTANEIRYLFGSGGNVAAALIESGSEVTTSIAQSFEGASKALGGGIVGSLAQNGVNTILNGGKIIFPEIWANSSFDRSYSIDIKLRSPDHDKLSIFLNVLKPYCKLLTLVLPRQITYKGKADPNGYSAPFLVRAYSKGMFNVDMGMITSMSVTKGAECCWNDDGLPTQIDISIEIKDLYSHLMMSKFGYTSPLSSLTGIVKNTSYMDFLANMAGLNIAQMEVGRRIKMFYYLSQTMAATTVSTAFMTFDQAVSRIIGKIYNIL